MPSPVGPWLTGYSPPPQAPRNRGGRAIALAALALAAIAVIGAAAALFLTATHLTHTAAQTPSPTPTFSSAQNTAARQQLCDTYKLAARAVGVDTHGNNAAFARIALTNAADLLDSANADPALDIKSRDAAHALATAYRTLTAKSSSDAFTDSEYGAALEDVKAKDRVMKKVCGDS